MEFRGRNKKSRLYEALPVLTPLKVERRVDTTKKFKLKDFVDPRNKIITAELIPVVDKALSRRHEAILQLKQECRKYHRKFTEASEKQRGVLEETRMRIANLRLTNDAKRQEIVKRRTENETLKQMTELKRHEKEKDKLFKEREQVEGHIRDIEKEEKIIIAFGKQIGIEFSFHAPALVPGCNVSYEYTFLLTCTKIHPNFPDDIYRLYFSYFDLADPGVVFTPLRAEPTVEDFERLQKIFTRSTDFKGFVSKMREYWKRDVSFRIQSTARAKLRPRKQQK